MSAVTPLSLSKNRNDWYPGIPLDTSKREIRLLRLLPAKNLEDEICIELVTTRLKHRWYVRYEALSYAWGGFSELHEINVNGRSGYKVNDNLFYALRRLRRRLATRVLWIDALCINQSDEVEQGHQVMLMRFIYARARCVLIWLGESQRQIGPGKKTRVRDGWGKEEDIEKLCRAASVSRDFARFAHLIKALSYTEPFWATRSWVIQEAAVARKILVLYGPFTSDRFFYLPLIPAEDAFDRDLDVYSQHVREHAPYLQEEFWKIREAVSDIYNIRLKFGTTGPQSLPTLMAMTSHTRATRAHDKLYCLLGLTDQCIADACVPNYDEPAMTVFARATFAQIKLSQRLQILAQVRISQDGLDSSTGSSTRYDTKTWPSWAVDFESPTNDVTLKDGGFDAARKPWKMDGKTACIDNKILSVTGFSIDTVQFFAGYYFSIDGETDIDKSLWAVIADAFDRCYRELPAEMFGRRTAETRHHEYEAWKDQPYDKWKQAYSAVAPHNFSLPSVFYHWDRLFGAAYEVDERSRHFWQERFPQLYQIHRRYVEFAGKGASLFSTSRGFIGLGVRGLREGDEVVQFNGSTWPMILRKVPETEDYTFRGHAFVSGSCDYKALGPLLPVDLQAHLRTYRIR